MQFTSEMKPFWRIPGTVVELREVRTKKDDRVFMYAVKMMAFGGMFELQTKNERLYAQVGEGSPVVAEGYFEQSNAMLRLVVTRFTDPSVQKKSS